MTGKVMNFGSRYLPRSVFKSFLQYKDVFEKFLNTESNKKKLFENKSNKVLLLQSILTDKNVRWPDEIKLGLNEYLLEFNSKLEGTRSSVTKLSRKLVKENYENRNFVHFEYFMQKSQKFDPLYERFYTLSRRQLFQGDVSVEEWKRLLADDQKAATHLQRYIYTQLIVKHVHLEDMDNAIQEYKNANKFFKFSVQDIRLAIGILKLAIKKNRHEEAEKFVEYVDGIIWDPDLKKLTRLKLLEVLAELHHDEKKPSEEETLWERAFLLLDEIKMPDVTRAKFRRLSEIYSDLKNKYRLLLDIRVSNREFDELYSMIRSNILNKTPFQFLRLGDGESYAYLSDVDADSQTIQDLETRELKWWGTVLPLKVRHQTVEKFLATLYQSDVVGIPSIFRFLRAMNNPQFSLDSNSDLRGSFIILENVYEDLQQKKIPNHCVLVEHRCHQNVFDKEHILELIKLASHTLVVSSYNREALATALNFPELDVIQIPGERLKHQALPFRIDEFVMQVKNKVRPGSLVLVASGFAGKYFLKIAKDHGAVALDVGAMVDYWMGRKTRQISDIV